MRIPPETNNTCFNLLPYDTSILERLQSVLYSAKFLLSQDDTSPLEVHTCQHLVSRILQHRFRR